MLSSRSARNKSEVFVVVMSLLFDVSFSLHVSVVIVMSVWAPWGAIGGGAAHTGSKGVRMLAELDSVGAGRAMLA